jgi:hypothetical protein
LAWIESHTHVSRNRKLIQVKQDLGCSVPQIVGHLHLLWHAALEQAEDGDLSSWDDAYIAYCAAWEGDAKAFCDSIRARKLLDALPSGEVLIHDWLDYAGRYLTGRYKTSDRDRLVAIWRKHGRDYGSGSALPKGSKQEAISLPTNQPTNLSNQPSDGSSDGSDEPYMVLAREVCAWAGAGIAHSPSGYKGLNDLLAECEGNMTLARECLAVAKAGAKSIRGAIPYAVTVAANKRAERAKQHQPQQPKVYHD